MVFAPNPSDGTQTRFESHKRIAIFLPLYNTTSGRKQDELVDQLGVHRAARCVRHFASL
jgi:hypothetical protein